MANMHIYIAGVGGAGLGPLAEIAHQLGHRISGSDLHDSAALDKMRSWQPPATINIGQTAEQIAATHATQPIDWYVYSSALAWAQPPNPELVWVKEAGIKHSKRDEFLNYLLDEKQLRLLAVAGSHGKTTTTAMIIWSLKELGEKLSYSLGGRLSGLPAAAMETGSEWFVYEADEFDRNFLSFKPQLSLITGIDHDHPEVFPTAEEYVAAFREFAGQSERVIIGQEDCSILYPEERQPAAVTPIHTRPPRPEFKLIGTVNRQNATLALAAIRHLKPDATEEMLIETLNRFPGSWRRFEEIAPGLYTDYAHNPVKIAGCLQIAAELNKPVVVVYEPHSNQRQHLVKDQYRNLFEGVEKVYWLPTYLSRENPDQQTLSPQDLIATLSNPSIAQPAVMGARLKAAIEADLRSGAIVVGMSAGGLDDWLRRQLGQKPILKILSLLVEFGNQPT